LPGEWAAELAEYANTIYQYNADFRRLMRKPGDRGWSWLWAFMRYWMCSLLDSRRPEFGGRLPSSYANGADLPPAADDGGLVAPARRAGIR
jgi:hypothetical protein